MLKSSLLLKKNANFNANQTLHKVKTNKNFQLTKSKKKVKKLYTFTKRLYLYMNLGVGLLYLEAISFSIVPISRLHVFSYVHIVISAIFSNNIFFSPAHHKYLPYLFLFMFQYVSICFKCYINIQQFALCVSQERQLIYITVYND